MSRNANSRFALNPSVDISRSKFQRNHSVKLSFNTGDIVPFYVDEVLPGDTFQLKTNIKNVLKSNKRWNNSCLYKIVFQ